MHDERTVYIAAPWSYRLSTRIVQQRFYEAGWYPVSRWVELHDSDDTQLGLLQSQAEDDVEDIRRADLFVLLNTAVSEGKATELGMALAWGIPCIVVGESASTNIFYNLSQIRRVRTVSEALYVAQTLP